MDVEQKQKNDTDLDHWYSTYGLITAQRLLSYYQIDLSQDMLIAALKSPMSFYHRILQVPMRNVLNGIVLQQAYDYNIYAQKLFIDYLLSPECASPETAPGASIRQHLEEIRQELVQAGDQFHLLELEHANIIADSQNILFEITQQWHTTMTQVIKDLVKIANKTGRQYKPSELKNAINHGLSFTLLHEPKATKLENHFVDKMNELLQIANVTQVKSDMEQSLTNLVAISLEFDGQLHDFQEKTKDIHKRAAGFRTQFYQKILQTLEQIKYLPEYKIDPVQDEINREALRFDKTLGESS